MPLLPSMMWVRHHLHLGTPQGQRLAASSEQLQVFLASCKHCHAHCIIRNMQTLSPDFSRPVFVVTSLVCHLATGLANKATTAHEGGFGDCPHISTHSLL